MASQARIRDFEDAWEMAGSEAPESEEDAKRRGSLRERLYTVGALRAMEPPESDQLLGPVLVRRHRTLLAGHTGEGKTTMAMHMLGAVARQEEFLGWKGAGGKVMIIDVEQGVRSIKRLIEEVRLPPEVLYWTIPEGLALEAERIDLEAIEEGIAEHRPDVVMADPLYKLHRGDPNDARLAAEVMRVLDAWRVEYGFAALIPVHPRKPPPQGGTFSKHDIFGAGAWIWGAETVLGIQRVGGNTSMLHFWKDRDGDLDVNEKWRLSFERERGFRREDSTSKLTATDQVARLLAETAPQWLSRKEIGTMAGIASATVKRAMEALEAAPNYPLRKRRGTDGAWLYSVDVAPDSDRYESLLEEDEDGF